MKRRLFNMCCLVPVMLCALVVVLWGRSYIWWDRGFICGSVANDSQSVFDFSSERGLLRFALQRTEGFSLGTSPREGANLYAQDIATSYPPDHPAYGFYLGQDISYRTYDHTAKTPPKDTTLTLAIPHWFAFFFTGIVPVLWAHRILLARRRLIAGLCPKCGYDLRASKERCPECGASIQDEVWPPS